MLTSKTPDQHQPRICPCEMSDDDSEVVEIGEWLIEGKVMRPSVSQMQNVCKWYSKNVNEDIPFSFVFHASHNAENVLIHESRLQLAGGPLAALTNKNFKEGKEKTVSLCEEDDPATFRVIRSFLYGAEIDLSEIDLTGLVKIAICSNRWGLTTLEHLVSRYIHLEELLQDSSDILATKRIVELHDVENVFESYFWETTGLIFNELSPSSSNDRADDVDDASLPSLATSIQKFPEMFEDVWTLAISKGFIELLFDNIICHTSRRTKKALVYVIAATIEPLLKEDSKLEVILRSIIQEVENLTSVLRTKEFQQLASSRMLNFMMVELCRSNILRKHAYDALNGMICSSFWRVPLVRDSNGVRKSFFTHSMYNTVELLQYTKRGRMLFPPCVRASSGQTPERLEAHVTLGWKVKSSSLKVNLTVTNADLFPNPFIAKVFLRTVRCNCQSSSDDDEYLYSLIMRRSQEFDSGEVGGSWEINEESLKHIVVQDKDDSSPCVVTLHIVVGHYPDGDGVRLD